MVTELTSDEFLSTKALLNKKVSVDGERVKWLQIQWIHFDRKQPNIMFFKYSFNPDAAFMSVHLDKRGRARSLSKVKMPLLYPIGRAVQHRKVLVLKALMTFVLPVHHAFYKHLKIDNVDDEDDGAGI